MATPDKYSNRNITNSLAGFLADKLLTTGYLVYWHEIDAVEVPGGSVYPQYEATQASYAANATFAAAVAASKGLITLRSTLPANPVFVTRPTSSGAVEGQETIPIPAFSVEVSGPTPIRPAELGGGLAQLKERTRHLTIFGFARTEIEQKLMEDWLGVWFDLNTPVDVKDHDAGDLAVIGYVTVAKVDVAGAVVVDGAEAETYAVELEARLEYTA